MSLDDQSIPTINVPKTVTFTGPHGTPLTLPADDDLWHRLRARIDTAEENARFWRRLALTASGACVVGTLINTADLMGWI